MANTTLSHDDLTAMVIRIFQGAGLSPLNAAALARVIVAGEGDACKSHGIYRSKAACARSRQARWCPTRCHRCTMTTAPWCA